MCFRQALVVRKAPSRWMASSFFQSANGKSTSGLTIWMPAFLTSTSILPYLAIDLGDALVHRILVGDVHRHRKGIAALGLDLGGGCVGGVEIEIGDDRNAALGGETQCDLLADAAGSTGDNRNSSIEAGH